MLALVTGGAGVVGKALCRELLAQNVCVRVLTLPGDTLASALPSQVEVYYGDVTKPETIRTAFDHVDVVYHLAAILLSTKAGAFDFVNFQGTKNVVDLAIEFRVKRLLYVSSISVTYPVLTEYGRSKLKGENYVRDAEKKGLCWTIVRPTLVIGDGGGIEYNMYAAYVNRFPVYFLPGGGRALKRPVRSVDLVKGIVVAGLVKQAAYKTYALAGSTVISMAQMAKCILKRARKHHLMIPIPWFIARRIAVLKSWIGGRRVTAEQALAGFLYDAVPEIDDATRDLGYKPLNPFA